MSKYESIWTSIKQVLAIFVISAIMCGSIFSFVYPPPGNSGVFTSGGIFTWVKSPGYGQFTTVKNSTVGPDSLCENPEGGENHPVKNPRVG